MYDRGVTDPAIVELARAAIRRLVDAAPDAADARAALARIEGIGLGPPYTVVIAGDPAARSELLNALAGERLFDPARRDPARIGLQLRRGPATLLRARRRDGSVDERGRELEPAGEPAPVEPPAPRRRAARHDDRAATVSASGDPAVQDAIVLSAEAETTAMVRRPPWWAVWRHLARWWRTWRARRSGSSAPALPAPAAPPVAPPAAARRGFANTVARRRADDPRRTLFPYTEVDRIAKLIPNTLHIKLDEALKQTPALDELYKKDARVRDLFDVARRLEGLARHASIHAAGIVISPKPLLEFVPLCTSTRTENMTRTEKQQVITQFEMTDLEKVGLIKMDFLALATLTILDDTVKLIQQHTGQKLNLEELVPDDPETYRLFQEGRTNCIFQFESSGMRDILRRYRPERFEDLIRPPSAACSSSM